LTFFGALVDPAQGRSGTLATESLDRPAPAPRTWTLTALREELITIGAKGVHHARAVTFLLAEVAVPRALFAATLGRIGRLRAAPSPG
jgi:hypothetical protein